MNPLFDGGDVLTTFTNRAFIRLSGSSLPELMNRHCGGDFGSNGCYREIMETLSGSDLLSTDDAHIERFTKGEMNCLVIHNPAHHFSTVDSVFETPKGQVILRTFIADGAAKNTTSVSTPDAPELGLL
mgnify:CR=1 FL=1